MAEFKRSRLEKKVDEEITKKTVFLGLLTVAVFIALLVFGLPLLIRFSVFLGDLKNRRSAEIVEKVLPPTAPRIILPFEATNSSQIKIGGLAERNVEVELLKNDFSIGKATVNDAGEFVFENIVLDEGESVFKAVAISEKGGSGEPSKEAKVVFDNKPPELTMQNPAEESLRVDSSDFDVIGQSERSVSVTINGRVAMVDDTGKFKLKLQLNTGKNDIEVIVRDNAGNETNKKISITYDI